jgi:uncharacterized membrane protein
MSDLIVVAYDDELKAEEVRLALAKLQKEHLIELEDAVVVIKDKEGKIKLNQAVNLTATGATGGGFWGLLVGSIFLTPIGGAAVGAASGAIAGKVSDYGIDDSFMKEVGATLAPETSALFVLVKKATPDKVLDAVKAYGGKVLQTSLSKEAEANLQAALSSIADASA